MSETILVSCWGDGVHVLRATERVHELPGRGVQGLARDEGGLALAILDAHSLCRRSTSGEWTVLATSAVPLACVVVAGPHVYVGTDDARVLQLTNTGELKPLGDFDAVAGRETWFAGGVWIDGIWHGPPLGVRSLTVTADGKSLLANVHVGGIPRSTDGGRTWHATIAVECDVHHVLAHPTDPDVVIAATAQGLGVSRDGGATWSIETAGLVAPYCSAVMFAGEDILVSASTDHFAAAGVVYRRSLASFEALVPVQGGFPSRTDGIVDTRCMDARATTYAIVDHGGNLYVSSDGGGIWTHRATGLSGSSSVLVV